MTFQLTKSSKVNLNLVWLATLVSKALADLFTIMTSPDDYEYEPLTQKYAIRVLELRPGNQNDSISCSLREAELQSGPNGFERLDYEALSYVSGNENDKDIISCDGSTLETTRTLYNILQRFRLPEQPRRLWIDTICINQSDTAEKSRQIAMKLEIFQSAKRVLIWLGDHDENSRAVISIIQKEAARMASSHSDPLSTSLTDFDESKQLHELWAKRDLQLKELNTIEDLFERPYFDRAWTQLEVSSNLSLACCGDFEMPFAVITGLASMVYKDDVPEPHMTPRSGLIYDWDFYHTGLLGADCGKLKDDLLGLLQIARNCDSSEPRDRVFAIYGLLSSSFHQGVERLPELDYSKPVEDLYREVAIFAMCSTKSLDVLRYVHHASVEAMEKISWVPDWNVYADCPMFGTGWVASEEQYGAHLPSTQSTRLDLRGVRFDRIREVSTYEKGAWEKPPLGIAGSWSSLLDAQPYPTGEPLVSAFSLAITASFSCVGRKHYPVVLSQAPRHLYAWLKETEHVDSISIIEEPGRDRIIDVAAAGDDDLFDIAGTDCFLSHPCFITDKNYIGLGPDIVQPGDICCVLFGGCVPFILRPVKNYYHLVGACYIHGWMQGRAMKLLRKKKLREEKFEIR